MGAKFLAKNYTGKSTRHIDVRYNFIRDYVEEGIVKIEFVISVENLADIFTKNTNTDIFENHSSKLLSNLGYKKEQSMEGCYD